MKKEALLILDDSSINKSDVIFLISKKYCTFDKNYMFKKKNEKENKYNLPTNYMFSIDMDLINKEFEHCIYIKSCGVDNYFKSMACTENFSAIYINGELYLKVEDNEDI